MKVQRSRETSRAILPSRMLIGGAGGAFVPCAFFPSLASSQQARILAIYQIAQERTRAQLNPNPSRIPGFSVN
jgi:hypothetical protein